MLLWCQQKCNVREPLSFRFPYVAMITDLIFTTKSISDIWGRYFDADAIPFFFSVGSVVAQCTLTQWKHVSGKRAKEKKNILEGKYFSVRI